MIKIKEIENSKLAKLLGYTITLYPFIFYIGVPTAELRKHELTHVEQIRSIGFISFYTSYIGYYVCNRLSGMNHAEAYLKIPYEQEAYAKETEI